MGSSDRTQSKCTNAPSLPLPAKDSCKVTAMQRGPIKATLVFGPLLKDHTQLCLYEEKTCNKSSVISMLVYIGCQLHMVDN